MLMAEPSTYVMFAFLKKNGYVFWWILRREMNSCHMLMAQPSTYDMFAFLEKNGYVDGSAVNI